MNLNLFGMGLWNKTEEKLKKKRGGMMIVEKDNISQSLS